MPVSVPGNRCYFLDLNSDINEKKCTEQCTQHTACYLMIVSIVHVSSSIWIFIFDCQDLVPMHNPTVPKPPGPIPTQLKSQNFQNGGLGLTINFIAKG